jgi:hypothetical protein
MTDCMIRACKLAQQPSVMLSPALHRQPSPAAPQVMILGDLNGATKIVGCQTEREAATGALQVERIRRRLDAGLGKAPGHVFGIVQTLSDPMRLKGCLREFGKYLGIVRGLPEMRPLVRTNPASRRSSSSRQAAIVVEITRFRSEELRLMSRIALAKNASTATASRRAPRSAESLSTTPRVAQISVFASWGRRSSGIRRRK